MSLFFENSSAGHAGMVQAKRPVLAILTIEDDIQMFRGNRNNFADIARAGDEQGFLVYVVTVRDLKLSQKRITGFAFDEDSQTWQKGTFPLPNIVYNRVPMREDELLPEVRKKIAACMKHPRIRLFNPYFFNKWNLIEWLSLSKTTKAYIPATRRLINRVSLRRMLKQHPFLYLKPVSGKAGAGIMSVKLQPERQLPYRLQVQEKRRSKSFRCGTIERLWTRIRRLSAGDAYIAQQGIQLATISDRHFDLRVLAQKTTSGKWDVTGIGARVAGSSSITTHVPRGGSIDDPERLLIESFGSEKGKAIFSKVRRASLLIARQIERGAKTKFGEMSMDLGVDQTGAIWFFEANSKPMKFDEPHIRKKSLERLFHYSHYLLNQKPKRSGSA